MDPDVNKEPPRQFYEARRRRLNILYDANKSVTNDQNRRQHLLMIRHAQFTTWLDLQRQDLRDDPDFEGAELTLLGAKVESLPDAPVLQPTMPYQQTPSSHVAKPDDQDFWAGV